MKKRKVVIATTLFVILNLFLVNTSWAQEIARHGECSKGEDVGVWGIILNSGFIGLILWALIFFFCALCPMLGIASILSACVSKFSRTPLATKLLLCCAGMLFVLGWLGAVSGTVDAFAGLASATGAEKAVILAQAISQALYSSAFSFLGCFVYLFFYTVSIIIFSSRLFFTDNKAMKKVPPPPKPHEAL
jgi:hypothetical protein